jgi:hypothetical protein
MKKESIKFKFETKKGQTVYFVEVNMRDAASMLNRSTFNKQGIFITELKIVHQTPRKIALSDEYITLFDRQKTDQEKESYNHYIEDVNVSIVTKELYFPNGIFSSCYTLNDPKKCIAKIKQKICDKINKDYGFLRFVDIEETIRNLEVINL